MGYVMKMLTGVGMLIFVGLLVWNYKGVVAVVDTISSNSVKGIKTLQGRA